MWRPATLKAAGLASTLVIAPIVLWGQETQISSIFTYSNVTLSVRDVRKSAAFYETVLEFKLEHYLVESAKEVTTLSPSDPEPYSAALIAGPQHIVLAKGVLPPEPESAHDTFHVKDVAVYHDRIVNRGVSVRVIARDTTGKPFWFSLVDPDGHWFMFFGETERR